MRLNEILAPTETVYHAAPASRVDVILREGIKPVSYWGRREIADYYAEEVVETGDDPIIFTVPLSRFREQFLQPDKPGIEEPLTYTLGMTEEEVCEEWEKTDQSWRSSYELIGSFSYHESLKVTETDIE